MAPALLKQPLVCYRVHLVDCLFGSSETYPSRQKRWNGDLFYSFILNSIKWVLYLHPCLWVQLKGMNRWCGKVLNFF